MQKDLTRRMFIGAAGSVVAAGATAGIAAEASTASPRPGTIKIVGLATSYRKGKTTAAAVQVCLEAAKAVDPEHIDIELIELADLKIPGAPAAGVALQPGEKDDFPSLMPRLADPQVAGIIIGTPVYFGNMSSLCKAFLDRCNVFRKNNFALSNKVAGVVAVAGGRNGGQEQTIRSVQTCLYGQEMIIVGDGRPTAHWGGTVWNKEKDDISGDDVGLASVRNLGRRVAEVARRLAKG
jgi:multimeric flavodoxin WrbA